MSLGGETAAGRGFGGLPDPELEARVSEFERLHEAAVRAGGPGWVPRIQSRDYLYAALVNLALIAWLVAVMVRG